MAGKRWKRTRESEEGHEPLEKLETRGARVRRGLRFLGATAGQRVSLTYRCGEEGAVGEGKRRWSFDATLAAKGGGSRFLSLLSLPLPYSAPLARVTRTRMDDETDVESRGAASLASLLDLEGLLNALCPPSLLFVRRLPRGVPQRSTAKSYSASPFTNPGAPLRFLSLSVLLDNNGRLTPH